MFFIWWRGLGLLTPAVLFALLLGMQFAIDTFFGQGYYSGHSWSRVLSILFSACVIWAIGSWLNEDADDTYVSSKTGKQIKLGASHSLYSIPVQYWAVVLLLFAVPEFSKDGRKPKDEYTRSPAYSVSTNSAQSPTTLTSAETYGQQQSPNLSRRSAFPIHSNGIHSGKNPVNEVRITSVAAEQ